MIFDLFRNQPAFDGINLVLVLILRRGDELDLVDLDVIIDIHADLFEGNIRRRKPRMFQGRLLGRVLADECSAFLLRESLSGRIRELPALSLQEFQNVCSYRRFPTMTFHEFVTFASPLFGGSGRRLILSVGRPSEAQLSVMLKQLKDELKNSMMNPKDLFLRVERRKDAEAVKAAGLQISLVFYIIPPKDQEAEDLAAFIRKQLAFCTKQKISLAALSEQYYDSETADLFQEAGVAPVVFTYIQTERILEALRSGAFAASHFYDPDYISDLIS